MKLQELSVRTCCEVLDILNPRMCLIFCGSEMDHTELANHVEHVRGKTPSNIPALEIDVTWQDHDGDAQSGSFADYLVSHFVKDWV